MTGYRLGFDADYHPRIYQDEEGTTSWRDAKKALRQWYLDKAKALRSVNEKEYFNDEPLQDNLGD